MQHKAQGHADAGHHPSTHRGVHQGHPQGNAGAANAIHGHTTGSPSQLATHVTLHCLVGCAIGEFVGLAIGVSLGLAPWATILLAVVLGFASGYLLGLWPLVRAGRTWGEAFKLIWLGETISIAVMEIVMNVVDYSLGGAHANSVFSSQFWVGYLLALPAGFIAAWPVNYWLLSREIKRSCH